MSVQIGMYKGFVNTEIRTHKRKQKSVDYCYLWTANDRGRDSEKVVILDASDCRNLAAELIERAEELEEEKR